MENSYILFTYIYELSFLTHPFHGMRFSSSSWKYRPLARVVMPVAG